jgi:hypothetical protein
VTPHPIRDEVIFSIRLKSGDFSSELHVPLPSTTEETNKLVERWMQFMITGLEINAEALTGTLTSTQPTTASPSPAQPVDEFSSR